MKPCHQVPSPWPRRIRRLAVVSLVLVFVLTTSATMVAFRVARTLTSFAGSFVEAMATAANSAINALYVGDSETRLTVLTQLKQMLDKQPLQSMDPQLAAWILPAIEQCLNDVDPNVVALADELIVNICINLPSAP